MLVLLLLGVTKQETVKTGEASTLAREMAAETVGVLGAAAVEEKLLAATSIRRCSSQASIDWDMEGNGGGKSGEPET
ncbi:hypothetical protein ACLOJK_030884 [Asimina triloba]